MNDMVTSFPIDEDIAKRMKAAIDRYDELIGRYRKVIKDYEEAINDIKQERYKQERYKQGFYDGYKKATDQANAVIAEIKAHLQKMADDEWNQQVGASKGLEDAIEVIESYTEGSAECQNVKKQTQQ